MRFCRIDQPQREPSHGPLRHNLPPEAWSAPPASPAPAADELQLWRGWLDTPDAVLQQLQPMLSAEERERARRFKFERDRRRFLIGRGLLRFILGGCLEMDPAQVRFGCGPSGKPCVAPDQNAGRLQFNVSHSDKLFLCVVARQREMGVDVEHIRRVPDADAIAARLFTAEEQARLQALVGQHRDEVFFTIWTRKEAWLKSLGMGLGGAAASLETGGDESAGWLLTFTPAPGFLGAVAAQPTDAERGLWSEV